ncbi:MAG: beta-galactosidase [Luteolibacter sp.]|uniref:beta-galactosidase n=1 Tax=Luteolibacter sp. TaxID=1962973 RepID=UPI0032670B35
MRKTLAALISMASLVTFSTAATFEVKGRDYLLDGRPFLILSGEMHYPRVPREYWHDRLKKAKAMGLNTICTYLFWNVHEPQPGKWDFSGNADFVAFIKACQEEGLHVLVRPGPYVCTEWEFGGYPGWILADPKTVVRSTDPKFLKPAMAYLEKVSAMLKPLQVENGGPVLMIQVENEYGSYGDDQAFLKAHVDAIRKGGYTGTLFTADPPNALEKGTIPGIAATVNFGNDAKKAFEKYEELRPGQARMIGEFWVGWFDHWGAPHASTEAGPKAAEFDWALSQGISANIYMFHGGTNWGFYAGSNWNGGRFEPDTTSYDYSALLDEAGRPTAKFDAFKEVIKKRVPNAVFGPMPEPLPIIEIPEIKLTAAAPLFSRPPDSQVSEQPKTMEALGQTFGYILYTTKVKGPFRGVLSVPSIRDRAIILVDGKRQGVPMDRRVNRFSAEVEIPAGEHTLGLFVENMGRINFSKEMVNERKGLIGPVKLGEKTLTGWTNIQYPFKPKWLDGRTTIDGDPKTVGKFEQPVIYRGGFTLEKTGDTWLDMRKFGKGVVWVNGHNLGRYWQVGAQQGLYLPGCWLKKGQNEIILLETDLSNTPLILTGVKEPIWQQNVEASRLSRKPGQEFKADGLEAVTEGEFAQGSDWQVVKLPAPATGRYFALESLDAYDDKPFAAVAELLFIDENGKDLPREKMHVVYADSEELTGDDGTAANVIDNQPTTFWHSEWKANKPAHPHQIVLDLGGEHTITGFRYLPRPGAGSQGGRIKRYRAFFSKELFPGL